MRERAVLVIQYFGLTVAAIGNNLLSPVLRAKYAMMESASSIALRMLQKNAMTTRFIGLTAAGKKARFSMTAKTILSETSAGISNAA
jgi:hypothetical protein